MAVIKEQMRIVAPILWTGFLMVSGCRTADEVATSSYNAATAPVSTTTVTTTTAGGTTAPVESRPRPTPPPERTELTTTETKPASTEAKPTPHPTPAELDFPTAKPVEGKPGYVYSPFDPGKYVDVSGYAPGSKVKDPYSGKIFKVP
jgi:hypothetical protein